MIKDIKSEFDSLKFDRKTIRDFGIVFSVLFMLLAVFLFYKGAKYAAYALLAGLFFLFSAVLFYKILIPLYKVWMLLGIILGWLVSRFVLIILFYFVFTPISLVLRILKKDILDEKIDRSGKSYWKKYTETDSPEHYKKQF